MPLGNAPVIALLRNRDVRLLLGAALVSQTGDWAIGTGVAFEVFALTGSTVASAAVVLATQIPQVVLAQAAGVVADRRDRRRTMVLADLVAAVVLVPLVFATSADRVWIVVLVTAAGACLAPLFNAAEAALLPALVGRPEALVTANAANAQVRSVARLVGAALGGVLVASGGLPLLALVDGGSFLVAAALIGAIRHRAPSALVDAAAPARWTAGLRAVRRDRVLTVLLLFFALGGLGEGILATLFAPFVRDLLGGTASIYGVILSAQAVGGIAGGALVTALGHRIPPRRLFGVGSVVFGAIDLVLFLAPLAVPAPWPAIVLIAVVGVPSAAAVAGATTLFQLATTDRDRGSVFGTLTTAQNGAMLLGTVAAGTLAARLGILPVIVTQGAVYTVAGAVAIAMLRGREADCRA